MVATPANAINEGGASGLCTFDGTATFSTAPLTQYYVISGASANTINSIAPSTSGFVLTSNGASSQPTFQAAASGGGLTWADQSGNFNAVKTNGYFCTAALTATLPASPSEGDTIAFVCTTTAIVVKANTGQTITLSSTSSTSAGTATNVASGDSLTLVYRSTGTTWWATSSVGNWTMA